MKPLPCLASPHRLPPLVARSLLVLPRRSRPAWHSRLCHLFSSDRSHLSDRILRNLSQSTLVAWAVIPHQPLAVAEPSHLSKRSADPWGWV